MRQAATGSASALAEPMAPDRDTLKGTSAQPPTRKGKPFMSRVIRSLILAVGFFLAYISQPVLAADGGGDAKPPEGWSAAAPRDEVRPAFTYRADGGPERTGALVIESDDREGLLGCWTRTYPITGGKSYRFSAFRRTENVECPRRCGVARVIWQDEQGRQVLRDEPSVASYLPGTPPVAEPEYPRDGLARADGWTEVSDVYRAPSKASRALVELWFRYSSLERTANRGAPDQASDNRGATRTERPAGHEESDRSERYNLSQHRYFFFVSRKRGDLTRVKSTISSPVTVLISWCRLSTLTPVISWTIASMIGRAVSINWILTCFRRSRPFSAWSVLTRCCSAAVRTPWSRITSKSPIRWVWTSLGPRPMHSCRKRVIPWQMAASISPDVFIGTSRMLQFQSPGGRGDNPCLSTRQQSRLPLLES